VKIGGGTIEYSLQMVRVTDQERGAINLLFVVAFAQEQHGELGCSGLKPPLVEDSVRVGIDSSVQPVELVVDTNHGFVNRNLIRGVRRWLAVGRPSGPGRDRCTTAIDTQPIIIYIGIRE